MKPLDGESFLAERLLWVFKKTGCSGEHTMPFLDLHRERQRRLSTQLELRDPEVPVVVCFHADDDWTLQTTRRLLWRDRTGTHEAENCEISNVSIDLQALRNARSKLQASGLVIQTRTGDAFRLALEPGPPLSGFWNVIKTIAGPP